MLFKVTYSNHFKMNYETKIDEELADYITEITSLEMLIEFARNSGESELVITGDDFDTLEIYNGYRE